MQPVEIRPSIFWVGVNDHHTEFFEGLWPIRDEGVSYNSYLIRDEKNAIIDLASKMSTDELVDQVETIVKIANLDYIVVNHMEPDHSGALKTILMLAPKVTILGSAKTREMLESFYGISERVQVVKDGEEVSLGNHMLRFYSTPWVHWPETIMTYETSQQILFPCDAFGGFGTLAGTIFDDPLRPLAWYEEQSLRYFVNIVASFCKPVRNALAKLQELQISIIAPSHGLVWKNHPERIIELYAKWAGYATEPGDPGVTLLYASMYGNTERMMEVVAQGVADEGVPLQIFNVAKIHISRILPSLWLNQGVLVGAPTYEGCLFPDMVHALEVAHIKHVPARTTAIFGSHAWLGGAKREFEEMIAEYKWDLTGSLDFFGAPSLDELEKGRRFGAEFARKVRLAAKK
jgi:anaerobic nitric oxide reductase flavorubredoxin